MNILIYNNDADVLILIKKKKGLQLDKLFGARLKKLRDKTGLSQQDAAAKIGVGYKSLQNHEGGRWPNQNNLHKYIDFYQCNRDWLLTGKGDPFIQIILEDESLTIASDEQSTKENIQNLSVHSATRYADDDLRNPEYIDILNIKTRKVLESKTGYANSLAANIESFYDAVVTSEKLKDHEKRLEQLEKSLSTDGREKEEKFSAAQNGN